MVDSKYHSRSARAATEDSIQRALGNSKSWLTVIRRTCHEEECEHQRGAGMETRSRPEYLACALILSQLPLLCDVLVTTHVAD